MTTPTATKPADPLALLRSRRYVALLVLAAILGVPIAAIAYFFLKLVAVLQRAVFTQLPSGLGFHGEPLWWPLLPLALAGVLVGLTIRYLPGRGGHSPADGFHAGGVITPAEIPGVFLAALATLALGAVLGPEAPLIALGGGLAVLAVRFRQRDLPAQTLAVVGAAGSFAAIATLFGSPLLAAFLLMEAVGLGGAMLDVVLLPGLLAAGVGALIFVGLDNWTGFGTFSLAIPHPPPYSHPDLAQFGWALVLAVAAAVTGTAIRRLALAIRPHVERRLLLLTPVAGLAVAGLAIAFAAGTGKSSSEVLFSGQTALPTFVGQAASYSVGALLLLLACKGLAYGVSLSSFRGGPVFPALFIGTVGGAAMSHLPGLPLVPAIAMGIGAMAVAMLRLPLTSVLLATLLLGSDGLAVTPLVIVAVVVAYVVVARIDPPAGTTAESRPAPAAAPREATPAPGAAPPASA
ncbi:MAG: chloride channel protein [Actinobacteria bacterium]|nr:chloride channel protein [Actinomycetota bacterium]